MCLLRTIRNYFIVSMLFFMLAACKKEKQFSVPQSLIDSYSSYCDQECKPQLNRVDLNGVDYISLEWSGASCPVQVKKFFRTDGFEVSLNQTYNELLYNAHFREVAWKCD